MKKIIMFIAVTLLFSGLSFGYEFTSKDIITLKTFEASVYIKSIDHPTFPAKLAPKLKKLISSTKTQRSKALVTELYKNLGYVYSRDGRKDYLKEDYQKVLASQTGERVNIYSFPGETIELATYYNMKGEYPKSDYLVSFRNLWGKGEKDTYYKSLEDNKYLLAYDATSGYNSKVLVLQAQNITELNKIIENKTAQEISTMLISGTDVKDGLSKFVLTSNDQSFDNINKFEVNNYISNEESIYSQIMQNSKTNLNIIKNKDDMVLYTSLIEKLGYTQKYIDNSINTQKKVRDIKRKGDINNLLTATISYFVDYGVFPSFGTFVKFEELEETLVPKYIEEIPLNITAGEYFYYKSIPNAGKKDNGIFLAVKMETISNCNFVAKDIDDLESQTKGKSKEEIQKMLITDSSTIKDEKGCFYVVVK